MLAGVPVFPVRFGDFLAALAASSYVCCTLTPVIPGVSFLGYEWRELAELRHASSAQTPSIGPPCNRASGSGEDFLLWVGPRQPGHGIQ